MYSSRPASHKYQDSVQTLDMPIRKKIILYLALLLLVLLWFIGVKNRDPHQYDNMRRTLELYEYQLKESKEHMAETMRLLGRRDCVTWDPDLPVIYAITPTYARPVQKAELTRLSHTLMLVQNLHWIVVEDSDHKTALVSSLLTETHLNFTHLYEQTPAEWKHKPKEPNWVKPRGVLQRNKALAWLRANLNAEVDRGVVYFADDDNAYSLQLFNEMRLTREVSVWPVGLVGGLMVEKPEVNLTTGRVVGWNSQWRPERPFPIDMAGFAINLQHLLKRPEVKFLLQVKGGWQESELLTHLTTLDRLEPLADNCTKVYVWHTRTEAPKLNMEDKLKAKGKRSDDGIQV
ncbi:galactosylgalactosylxylosylprotein 3-beta-glucuronosyltransferase I-like [Macrosteles quadrilineatus]|uniref:galactosylgalactosylxylosylprotein 3-beta-glucuronosyltransferase I-like n=1 Tax=Macrosteles quadrilineatus TaxID=74068 RepID=UPI0023E21F93|nr:galactosylgalactosylxylosylprotein 3-beta-glucuronosyltransferase I-like [Macrosteles quadrilineatus]